MPGVAAVSVGDGVPLDLVGNYASVTDADRPDEEPTLVERATRPQRQMAGLASGLGLLALLLCTIGVYGVVAFAVTYRTREIGLRMAMGATRQGVLRRVLRDAVLLAAPGLAIGALFAAAAGATFRSILLSVSPLEPMLALRHG